jgi:hypothetical protein
VAKIGQILMSFGFASVKLSIPVPAVCRTKQFGATRIHERFDWTGEIEAACNCASIHCRGVRVRPFLADFKVFFKRHFRKEAPL